MKKFFIYFIIFSLLLSCSEDDDNDSNNNGSNPNAFRVKKVTIYDNEKAIERNFTYNNNLISNHNYDIEANNIKFAFKAAYTYTDSKITILEKVTQTTVEAENSKTELTLVNSKISTITEYVPNDNNELEKSTLYTCEYNSNGSLEFYIESYFINNTAKLYEKTHFEYTGELLNTMSIYEYTNNSWVKKVKALFEFENEKISEYVLYNVENNIDKEAEKFVYKYDDKGILEKKIIYLKNGDNWEQEEERLAKYDNNGNFTHYEGTNKPKMKFEYEQGEGNFNTLFNIEIPKLKGLPLNAF